MQQGRGLLRIAIDARMIGFSGIGRYIQNLLANLPKIDNKNAYSAVINAPERGLYEIGDIEFHSPRFNIPVYSLREQILLPSGIKALKPDLIHYPSFNIPVYNSGPVVVTIHDLDYYVYPEACPNRLAHMYARFMFKKSVNAASMIITVSEHSKKEIVRHLGVDPAKVRVIYHGVDEVYRPVKDPARLKEVSVRYGIKGDYVFYAGIHHPRKNLIRLVEAFSRLKGKKDLLLVIAGKIDPRRKELYSLPERLKVKEKVIFTGLVPEEDLPSLYSMASVFVFPSLYEGFGLPPLEAMACGTPVISSNTTSLPEVVGDAGIMVDPEDVNSLSYSIEKVLSDPDLRSELKTKGLERVKQFNWRLTAEKTLAVYNEVMSGR